MKFKVGKFIVDSRTFVEIRKKGIIPQLYVHEKFEKVLRWIKWIATFLSVAIIFIAFGNYYVGVAVGLMVFAISTLFDKAILKYTTFIIQPPPPFIVDYAQWYNVMTISDPNYLKNVNVVGFVYRDIEYGGKFFKYLKEWSFGNEFDRNGNIILSIVEEDSRTFTFYIYANPERRHLDEMFEAEELNNTIQKKKNNKHQERLVMQSGYWHTVQYTNATHMEDFLKNQPKDASFMLAPSMKVINGYSLDLNNKLILKGYKYSKRKDLPRHAWENSLDKIGELQKKNKIA